jgi:cell division septation protein DedD
MKKIALIVCILLLVVCGKKQTTVQTEGLEEVIVFGEEENVSSEPVLPATPSEEVTPVEEPMLPPPVEEEIVSPPVEEEPVMPTEEIAIAPTVVEEEPLLPVLPVEETPPMVMEEPYTPSVAPSPPAAPSRAPASVLGFRVQVFASSTENNADRVAADARSSFNRVYVDYIAPYYKVRVGDCMTREEAEIIKNKARTLGYRGAFIIETMISP